MQLSLNFIISFSIVLTYQYQLLLHPSHSLLLKSRLKSVKSLLIYQILLIYHEFRRPLNIHLFLQKLNTYHHDSHKFFRLLNCHGLEITPYVGYSEIYNILLYQNKIIYHQFHKKGFYRLKGMQFVNYYFDWAIFLYLFRQALLL